MNILSRLRHMNKEQILFIVLLIIGTLSSFIMLGDIPAGINQDEAYAGYEAYSLLHYGVDSHGYVNPVYFVSWGSGMNSLYSYLSIPFIALFGLNSVSIRMVQAIFSVVLMVFTFKFVKRVSGSQCALWSLFFLVISPWRICMSRWGLESNLTPAFVMITLYFLVKVIDSDKYLIPACLFAGLSLYCYALMWIFMPLLLLCCGIYLWQIDKLRFNRIFVISFVILFVLACPLILFLLIQWGVIPEIRTEFISIPFLSGLRDDMFSFDILRNLCNLFCLAVFQTDFTACNSTMGYGLYYFINTVLVFTGIFIICRHIYKCIKSRKMDLNIFYAIYIVIVLLQGSILAYTNVNRMNSMHVLNIMLIAVSVEALIRKFAKYKFVSLSVIVANLVLFFAFIFVYFTDYASFIANEFQKGFCDAVTWSHEQLDKSDIVIVTDLNSNYSKYLFLTEYPTEQFVSSVNYTNYPDKWLYVASFDGVQFVENISDDDISTDNVYIFSSDNIKMFVDSGFSVQKFNGWVVAY